MRLSLPGILACATVGAYVAVVAALPAANRPAVAALTLAPTGVVAALFGLRAALAVVALLIAANVVLLPLANLVSVGGIVGHLILLPVAGGISWLRRLNHRVRDGVEA